MLIGRHKLNEDEQKIYDAVITDPISMSYIHYARRRSDYIGRHAYNDMIDLMVMEKADLLNIPLMGLSRNHIGMNIIMELAGM